MWVVLGEDLGGVVPRQPLEFVIQVSLQLVVYLLGLSCILDPRPEDLDWEWLDKLQSLEVILRNREIPKFV